MILEVNAVIFDFDGVIINSGADIANAAQYTLKYFKKTVLTKDEIISYVGHGAEILIRRCFKECSEEVILQAIPFYKKYFLNNALIETKLYPNVKETLKVIKEKWKDKKIALVTNKPEDISKKILAGLDIRQFFDLILGPESVKEIKPDPEGIRKVLDTFGIAAERAIMEGDSYVDIQAGRNAGTKTCGVMYGLGNKEELLESTPDLYISDMIQLLEHIK
jgi:phosphoglycolate phosphatase